MLIQVKKIPIKEGQQHSHDRILLIGTMSGKMYLPSAQDLIDEEFSPMLTCLLVESSHTREEIKHHWDNRGTLTF